VPLVLAASLDALHVTELVTGAAAGLALGGVAVAAPRAGRLLAPAAAVLAALALWALGLGSGWVVVAVAVPALAAVVPLLDDAVPPVAATGLAVVAALAGAALLAPAAPTVPRAAVVVGAAAVAALAAVPADRWLRPAALVALGAWTAFGLFLCSPDTERASLVGALMAATAVMTSLAAWVLPGRAARSHPVPRATGSAVPLVVLLVWVGAVGANQREEAIIAGYACLGVLLVLPVAAGLAALVPRPGSTPVRLRATLAVAVQAPLVVAVARLGGVRTTAERAAVVSLAALLLASAAVTLALGLGRRPDPIDDPTELDAATG
jgi:hypothetical protein